MRIAMIGTGYVGSVAGVCFAENGHDVICVDQDRKKVQELSKGNPVIYEPGLEPLLKRNLAARRIRFTDSISEAVQQSEIVFMTVGTPSKADGSANLDYLENAAREVGRAVRSPIVVVNKSTVPVGTHRWVAAWIRDETTVPVQVVSNPEFLREGAALRDFMEPDRVVIGTHHPEAFQMMRRLYLPFVKQASQIIRMDPVSAELTKYACNAFLATRISFMNDLSHLCEKAGGDIEHVQRGMGSDTRIGPRFLNAGIGYGGSCFPKDIRALLRTAQEHEISLRIVSAVEEVNERQKLTLVPKILAHLGRFAAKKKVTLWGLAFKPQTDDTRESPAIVLAQELIRRGVRVAVFDPVAASKALETLGPQVEYCDDPYSALRDSNALVIATEWPEFQNPDYARVKLLMTEPAIFDGRNLLSADAATRAGFSYWSIGRKPRTGARIRVREPNVVI